MTHSKPKADMEVAIIGNVLVLLLFSSAFIRSSATSSITINPQNNDKGLTSTTIQLLSSFERCVVFIFDWALVDDYGSWTSTSYFLFFSQSMNCAVVVDSYTSFHNGSKINIRFEFQSAVWEPHALLTKYTTTLINLYGAQATSKAIHFGTVNYLVGILLRYNVPFNHVLIFTNNRLFSSLNINPFSLFPEISTPSAYTLILDEEEVYVIGFAQAVQSAPYLFRADVPHVAEIQRLHKMIHQDFQKARLDVKLGIPREFCTSTSQNVQIPNECIINLVVEHLNLTFCDVLHNPCVGSRIGITAPSSNMADLKILTRKTHINLDLINYAASYLEYRFICIVKTEMMGWRAFVKAYDLSAWLVTVAACVIMTATLAAMSTKANGSMWTKIQASAVVVLMLLIDRFYQQPQLARASSVSTRKTLLITLWAFCTLLLGMCYSGNMVSEITSPSLPPIPRDMQELSQVKYSVFTTSKMARSINNVLHIKPYLQTEIEDFLSAQGGHNDTLTLTVRRLGKALISNQSIDSLASAGNRKSSQVLYAYADTTPVVKTYEIWSTLYQNRRRALHGGTLPFLNQRICIAVKSNFLSPVFNWCLASIYESGVFKYWQNVIDGRLVSYTASLHKSLGTKWMRITRLAAIWQNFEPLLNERSSWNVITLENLNAAFKFVGTGALLSLLVLINERWPVRVGLRVIIRKVGDVVNAVWGQLLNLGVRLAICSIAIIVRLRQ